VKIEIGLRGHARAALVATELKKRQLGFKNREGHDRRARVTYQFHSSMSSASVPDRRAESHASVSLRPSMRATMLG